MATKFFTADFHFGSAVLLDKTSMREDLRPFKSTDAMNNYIIAECKQRAHYDDCIIHVGDLGCYKKDREFFGLDVKPIELLKDVDTQFVLVEGNHDANNHVRCATKAMITDVGPYVVSVSHFPSYDSRCLMLSPSRYEGIRIHICGHVHKKWLTHYDKGKRVLNINVGLDVWKYHLVPEKKLIGFISSYLAQEKKKLDAIEWF